MALIGATGEQRTGPYPLPPGRSEFECDIGGGERVSAQHAQHHFRIGYLVAQPDAVFGFTEPAKI